MLRFLHGNILLLAYESGLNGRKAFRYWKDLERSQWLPRTELEELQFAALRRLVGHAFSHCPYYREMWLQRGLEPQRLQAGPGARPTANSSNVPFTGRLGQTST
jgi:hypothetical protein